MMILMMMMTANALKAASAQVKVSLLAPKHLVEQHYS
jgi:hypothetical protein